MADKEGEFHGFAEDDATKTKSAVQNKLAKLRRLEIECRQLQIQGSRSESAAVQPDSDRKRPMNRFLKQRTDSGGNNISLSPLKAPVRSQSALLSEGVTSLAQSVDAATSLAAKKRSMSADTATTSSLKSTNRKRKLSAGKGGPQVPAIPSLNGTKLADAPSAGIEFTETNGRPRRTIIPNRKFLDEEPPTTTSKEPLNASPSKKAAVVEVEVEHKRKRRKSEKVTSTAQVQQSNNNNTNDVGVASAAVSSNIPLKQVAPVKISNGIGLGSTKQHLPTKPENGTKLVEVLSCPPAGTGTEFTEANGRPRRTIIPNRKFMDEDPPPPSTSKESIILSPVKKTAVTIVEVEVATKRTRRKSEKITSPAQVQKINNNNTNTDVVDSAAVTINTLLKPKPVSPVKISNDIGLISVPPLTTKSEKKVSVSTKACVPPSQQFTNVNKINGNVANGNGGSMQNNMPVGNPSKAAAVAVADFTIKMKVPEPVRETKVEDELPLSEDEAKIYKTNPIFLGTCILKASDSNEVQNSQGGIIYCGICSRVKKYLIIPEKRKRGSFLCSDCVNIVNKIFQIAMKARPFDCILGPPVCEGSCPLIFSPADQFCEACFAKSCLRNLPLKDDIYFKIWRSIPPMSRGCVPTAPVVNSASPYVGKVAYVKENGEIASTTGSLKIFGGAAARKSTTKSSGIDAGASEDSNASLDLANGNDDLNSARITTFSHRLTGSNRENTLPATKHEESTASAGSSLDLHLKETIKPTSNGVLQSHEEILLGRQIGQEERVPGALVDPILKQIVVDGESQDHIEIFGFPVVVSGPSYPRKPLCFLCGSAGIEQLIYCSFCCEPYHPYCAGDDLLLNTYIARCNNNEDGSSVTNQSVVDPLKLVLKWTCRRCLSCKSCGDCIGPRKELIRCNRCQNPYHLDSCIDKQILAKIKDREKLKQIWTCDVCMKCKSCGKRIESSQRLRTIQEVAAAAEVEEEEEEASSDDDNNNQGVCSASNNCLMLCLECFKQRKKGSFCPICEVCYDDNDWDSKMMECCKCNRWIHAACENLDDEQYHILGRLPDYIEYICRLCHASSTNPLWFEAIQSLLIKECNSAVRLFEQKCLGSLRRRRSSTDLMISRASCVRNLFGDMTEIKDETWIEVEEILQNEDSTRSIDHDENNKYYCDRDSRGGSTPSTVVSESPPQSPPSPWPPEESFMMMTPDKPKRIVPKSVSSKELLGCKVILRDFIKYPATLQENWYALKILGVEIFNPVWNPDCMIEEPKVPTTPIHSTPRKVFTPSKYISSITTSLNKVVGSSGVTTLCGFRKTMISAIEKACGEYGSEVEKEVLAENAKSAFLETFPWFVDQNSTIKPQQTPPPEEDLPPEQEVSSELDLPSTLDDPFKEVYWNYLDFFDDRPCALCGEVGDFPPESCGRLLWCGVNEWIHCNCAIWSSEVWEMDSGALQQVGGALNRGKSLRCKICDLKGATVSCCHSTCKNSYHFKCAVDANCFLMENKTMFCSHHKLTPQQLKGAEVQEDMKVGRKVFVDLDWIQKRGLRAYSDQIRVYIGSLKIDNLGEILPISVAPKEWATTSQAAATLLIPDKFQSHRIFWSMTEPWNKETYTFQTGISASGFDETRKCIDPGVNLVVDHAGKNEMTVQRGLEGVKNYHKWLAMTPKYIDENTLEWLTPPSPACLEEFYGAQDQESDDDNDEESGIDAFNIGRSSPSSVSSFGSFKQVASKFIRSGGSLRKRETILADKGDSATEGYASSVDSSFFEMPKSTKQIKRRRSSCKTKKSPKKRGGSSVTADRLGKYESPRRRSMRNLHLKETDESYCGTEKPAANLEVDDSDGDSGVTEGTTVSSSSVTESDATGAKLLCCRVNLFGQFNESFAEEQNNQEYVEETESVDGVGMMDTISLSSSTLLLDREVCSQESSSPAMQLPYNQNHHAEKDVFSATIKFGVKLQDNLIYQSSGAKECWTFLFDKVCKTRENRNLCGLVNPTLNVYLCDGYFEIANSFRMLGLSHRSVQFVLEQLPGVFDVVNKHKFRYSHRPYIDPNDENAVIQPNSTGSARSEGFSRRKPVDMFGWLASRHRKVPMSCDISEESSRSQGLPLAMQFRDLREKARKKFVVLHSEIHGRGLFARCDVEKGEMMIEYAGEVIRPSLTDPRERYYESRGIGCYMFRIKTQVIDATLKGNAARFINHSCEPNCEAKTIRILGKDHIIIFALRKIFKAEELTYDYKFEREEDKIPCSCGAARCRKYMN